MHRSPEFTTPKLTEDLIFDPEQERRIGAAVESDLVVLTETEAQRLCLW